MEPSAVDNAPVDSWNRVIKKPEHQEQVVHTVNHLEVIETSRCVSVDYGSINDFVNVEVGSQVTDRLNEYIAAATEEIFMEPFIWCLNPWLLKRNVLLMVSLMSRYLEWSGLENWDSYSKTRLSNLTDSTLFTDENLRRNMGQISFIRPVAQVFKITIHEQVQAATIQTRFQDAVPDPHGEYKWELSKLPFLPERSQFASSSILNFTVVGGRVPRPNQMRRNCLFHRFKTSLCWAHNSTALVVLSRSYSPSIKGYV